MGEDWQVGDLALCVDDEPREFDTNPDIRNGQIYRVYGVGVDHYDRIGLFLDEVESNGFAGGYLADRFRKIRPHTPDAEDVETIRLLNGAPVLEPTP